MKALKIAIFVIGLGFCLTLAATWADASSPRSVFLWSGYSNIIKDGIINNEFLNSLYNFCISPHGDNTKPINTLYLCTETTTSGQNLIYDFPDELRAFLEDAHYNGFRIYYLTGDASWATSSGRNIGEARVDEVIMFNNDGSFDERFDGVQFDVEPYLLEEWGTNTQDIWNEYITLLTNCQNKINSYNIANTHKMEFGVAIPFWYDEDDMDPEVKHNPAVTNPLDIQKIVDYVSIMAYRDDACGPAGIITLVQGEIANGITLGKEDSVEIIVETKNLGKENNNLTFFEEGFIYMEEQLEYVDNEFINEEKISYRGISIHHYDTYETLSSTPSQREEE